MNINVPMYTREGFVFAWEDGFSIRCTTNDFGVCIEANKVLNGILSDGSHVKLNLGITGGIQYQWQGLRRHECPIDIAFACD